VTSHNAVVHPRSCRSSARRRRQAGFQRSFLVCGLLMPVGGVVAILIVDPERDAMR
jgi:hypothetical protein